VKFRKKEKSECSSIEVSKISAQACTKFVADELDDEEEEEGFKLPTLIRHLQTILDQYPDDGQILKVNVFPAQSWTWIGSIHGLKWVGLDQDFQEILWIELDSVT